MSIIEQIDQSYFDWMRGNNRMPDSVLMSHDDYHKLYGEIAQAMPNYTLLSPDAKLKYKGLNIIRSHDIKQIRVFRLEAIKS